jgi:hypothetical protein
LGGARLDLIDRTGEDLLARVEAKVDERIREQYLNPLLSE